jgi:hypothetical protein
MGSQNLPKTIQRIKLSSIHIAVKGGAVFSQLRRANRHDGRLPSILQNDARDTYMTQFLANQIAYHRSFPLALEDLLRPSHEDSAANFVAEIET